MRQFRQCLCLETEQDWTENLGNFGWFWYESGTIEKKDKPTHFPAQFKKKMNILCPDSALLTAPAAKKKC